MELCVFVTKTLMLYCRLNVVVIKALYGRNNAISWNWRCNKGIVLQGQCWSLELCVVVTSHFIIGSVLLIKLCMIVTKVRYHTVGSTPFIGAVQDYIKGILL